MRKAILLATLVLLPSAALSQATSNWENQDISDDFDGYIKLSAVDVGYTSINIRSRGEETDIIIITGDGHICRKGDSYRLMGQFIIDGERLEDEPMIISDSREALFFPDERVSIWIERLNKGKNLKMRVTDGCHDTTRLEFDITGHTRFGETP